MAVSIIIPTLNEAKALPRTLASLAVLDPAPLEIILVDAGSTDETRTLADAGGAKVIEGLPQNRAIQMNAGAAAAKGDIVCFLHADTALPNDFVELAERVLTDRKTALAGFISIMRGKKVRRITTAHNFIKTWYAPLFFRPVSFLKGCRLLLW